MKTLTKMFGVWCWSLLLMSLSFSANDKAAEELRIAQEKDANKKAQLVEQKMADTFLRDKISMGDITAEQKRAISNLINAREKFEQISLELDFDINSPSITAEEKKAMFDDVIEARDKFDKTSLEINFSTRSASITKEEKKVIFDLIDAQEKFNQLSLAIDFDTKSPSITAEEKKAMFDLVDAQEKFNQLSLEIDNSPSITAEEKKAMFDAIDAQEKAERVTAEKDSYYFNLKTETTGQEYPNSGSRDCESSADFYDNWGDGCDYYDTNTWACSYTDWWSAGSGDALVDCCGCGGGTEVADEEENTDECGEGETAYTWSYAGSWASEVAWTLTDADGNEAAAGDGSSGTVCLADGDYTATMIDSYGDGWNGAVAFSDADGNVVVTIAMNACSSWEEYYGYCNGSLITAGVSFGGTPPVSGCTDSSAPEYNADAEVDDGSCWANCAGNAGWIGDGYCDGSNNNEGCAYDGGDCCPGDCVDGSYSCASYGGTCDDCVNPDSADNADDGQCATPPSCADQGLWDCGDGQCIPESFVCDG
ncbi:MAG: hypothetical protein CMG66_05030, partial [Candidatus Marinimicrobia bacterium]|nr:hypothetical protein [Candidatus Neomarinimicrobiota bacterium]